MTSKFRIAPVFSHDSEKTFYRVQKGDYHGDGIGMDAYDWIDIDRSPFISLDGAKRRIDQLLELEKVETEFYKNNKPFEYL